MKVKAYIAKDNKTGFKDVYFLVSDSWVKVVLFNQEPEDLIDQLIKQAKIGQPSKLKNRFAFAIEPKLIKEFDI